MENAEVKVTLSNHEFKFGANSFMLGMYDTEEENKLWEEKYAKILNYTVSPLYWNSLEPEPGKLRFSEDSEKIWRRPSLDSVKKFAERNNLRTKGHCLMYNCFNPDWMSDDIRELKMQVEDRSKEIGDAYGRDFCDLDVINEMFYVYKNAYKEICGPGGWIRNYPLCDDPDHVRWCFDVAKKYFPHSRLMWNEGCFETFGFKNFLGDKSRYYLMLKKWIGEGVPIEGIGMQFHVLDGAVKHPDDIISLYNVYRNFEIFNTYSEFNLPIHISEVDIPANSDSPEDEEIQAELVKRMYKMWFSVKNIDAVVWWNLADGGARTGGLIRSDLSEKPAYKALDNLINGEWKTDITLKTAADGRAIFHGFYGDYDVVVNSDGKHTEGVYKFRKENTGYQHDVVKRRAYNLREREVVLK